MKGKAHCHHIATGAKRMAALLKLAPRVSNATENYSMKVDMGSSLPCPARAGSSATAQVEVPLAALRHVKPGSMSVHE